MLYLQRAAGNAAVAQLLIEQGVFVQRKPPATATKPKARTTAPASAPTTAPTGDVAIITGYLGRQIDNWHEGARQACQEFYDWSLPKPGVGKDFWMSLAGNMVWAIGESSPFGVAGVLFGALGQVDASGTAAKKFGSAKAIFDDVLKRINNARSELMREGALEEWASKALADPTVSGAVHAMKPEVWTPLVKAVVHPPDGDNVEVAKSGIRTELYKRYWDANVTQVEVVWAAYQDQPMGINIGLEGWPEVARIIQQGDVNWHIYKDKTIVGEKGGERTVIDVNHPARAKVEEFVRQLEPRAIAE